MIILHWLMNMIQTVLIIYPTVWKEEAIDVESSFRSLIDFWKKVTHKRNCGNLSDSFSSGVSQRQFY